MQAPYFYSRYAESVVTRANLPHWSQRCACFVTFRLFDSLPQEKLAALREYDARGSEGSLRGSGEGSLRGSGVPPLEGDETSLFKRRDAASPDAASPDAASPDQMLLPREESWLDAGYGACWLGRDDIRKIVEDALRHFSDVRYSLYAFVVMPNHVHVLFMPEEGFTVAEILQSWKSFTSKAINRKLEREGVVWQKEYWDRLIRSQVHFDAVRDYIVSNDSNRAYDYYRSLVA